MANSQIDRLTSVYIAEMAQKAQRYDDMVIEMNNVANMVENLTEDERNLLSVAYKNAIGPRMEFWRILSVIEQVKKSRSNETNVGRINGYKLKVESEIIKICGDILSIIDKHFIPENSTPADSLFYNKMKGDYYMYLAELKTDADDADDDVVDEHADDADDEHADDADDDAGDEHDDDADDEEDESPVGVYEKHLIERIFCDNVDESVYASASWAALIKRVNAQDEALTGVKLFYDLSTITAPVVSTGVARPGEEEGFDPRDIQLVMNQAGSEIRAEAIEALKNHNGDLVDAIVELNNKQVILL